jgi:hypothetical protein
MVKAKKLSTPDPVGLFLDGSGNVGWTLFGMSRAMPLLAHGTFQTVPQSASEYGRRLLFTAGWLERRILQYKPALIGFEAPFMPPPPPKSKKKRQAWRGFQVSADTLRFLICICGVFEMVAAKFGIECREVNVQTAKASLAGRAKKIERDATLLDMKRMGATPAELKIASFKLRRISKDDMIAAAIARGWRIDDEHQADACGVAKVIIENRTGGPKDAGVARVPGSGRRAGMAGALGI